MQKNKAALPPRESRFVFPAKTFLLLDLPINLSPVSDLDDPDRKSIVLDGVNYPVLTLSYPPQLYPGKLLRTGGPRVFSKRLDPLQDLREIFFRQDLQFTGRGLLYEEGSLWGQALTV